MCAHDNSAVLSSTRWPRVHGRSSVKYKVRTHFIKRSHTRAHHRSVSFRVSTFDSDRSSKVLRRPTEGTGGRRLRGSNETTFHLVGRYLPCEIRLIKNAGFGSTRYHVEFVRITERREMMCNCIVNSSVDGNVTLFFRPSLRGRSVVGRRHPDTPSS